MLTLALKADFAATKKKLSLPQGANTQDLLDKILEIFPKIKRDLLHRYEFRAVSYMSDVTDMDLCSDAMSLINAGIQHKSTIVITTPPDLRALQVNPILNDIDDDDDDDNKEAKNEYQGLTNSGVLEKLIQGVVEPKEEKLLLRYFDVHAVEMVELDGFVTLPKSILHKIVKRKRLAIEEKKLFCALVSWGKAECERTGVDDKPDNIRDILDEELPFIRFPTMLIEDVSSIVVPTQLLSQEELLQLYRYLGSADDKKAEIQMPFHCVPRKPRLAPNIFDFIWDKDRKHSVIVVGQDGMVVESSLQNEWQSIFANSFTPKKGCFEWFLTLDEYNISNTYNVVIGVVPDSFTSWTQTTICGYESVGWTFICGTGNKCHKSKPVEYAKLTEPIKKGDKVGVRVDMDKGEISFIHNGKNLGMAYTGLPKKLLPCLSLVEKQKVTLTFPNKTDK